jgi:tight adherence protein C
MFELWLVIALVGTFLTIFLIGVIVDMAMRERNRPMALLQSAAGTTAVDSVDLREEQLSGNVFDRTVVPAAGRAGRRIFRLTPLDMYGRINRKLVLAGSPPGLDAERIVAFKIIGAVAGIILGIFLTTLFSPPFLFSVIIIALVGYLGYVVPSLQVSSLAARRQKEIQRQLPDVMDLLTISVEAGLGFDSALTQVTKNVPGALAEEMSRLLQEIQIGVGRAEAFRHMGERTDVPELQSFVLSMIQADLFGVSIASVLRSQSRELRQKRRQRAEELAQKIPVKLLFPMIFLVLPAMFVVLLGPGIIEIYRSFFE